MPTTLTSSQVNAVVAGTFFPNVNPGRLNASWASFNFGGSTLTVGQVVQMLAIPTGCVVHEILVSAEFTGNTAGLYTIGDGSLTNRYCTNASLTASSRTTRASSGIGWKISVSDDSTTRFDTIDISIGAGATQTLTGSIQMVCYYRYVGITGD